jgi:hypothetical protein
MKMVRGFTLKKILELLAEGAEATVKKYPLAVLLIHAKIHFMKSVSLLLNSLASFITALSVPVALEFAFAQPAAAADIRTTREYFVGKTWKSPSGTTYTFLDGGQCVKTAAGKPDNFQWKDVGGGAIEARGADPRETRYFRFVSATEAYYGRELNNITMAVTPVAPAGAAPAVAPAASPTHSPLGAATPSMKDFYLDKTWQSPAGTTFKFLPGGKCVTTNNLKEDVRKWRTIGPRILEVSGPTPQETRYFRFVSPTEAYYGANKNQIFTPITAK